MLLVSFGYLEYTLWIEENINILWLFLLIIRPTTFTVAPYMLHISCKPHVPTVTQPRAICITKYLCLVNYIGLVEIWQCGCQFPLVIHISFDSECHACQLRRGRSNPPNKSMAGARVGPVSAAMTAFNAPNQTLVATSGIYPNTWSSGLGAGVSGARSDLSWPILTSVCWGSLISRGYLPSRGKRCRGE